MKSSRKQHRKQERSGSVIRVVIGVIAVAALAAGGACVFFSKRNASGKSRRPMLTDKHWELFDFIKEMQNMYDVMDEYYRTHR